MEFNEIYSQLGILFLTMLVGLILGKINLITPIATKFLSKFVLKVAIPALLISGMLIPLTSEKLHTAFVILLLSIPSYGLAYLVGKITAKLLTKDTNDKAIFTYALVFSNAGFIGFPVFLALFGKEALFYAVIYNIAYNVFMYTLGMKIITANNKTNNKMDLKLLLNSGIIASVIGFFLFVTQIQLPEFIVGTIDSIGSLCVPLSMLTIGAMLSELPLKSMFSDYRIYFLTFVRLLLLPVLILILLKYIFKLEDIWLIAIPVITAGMPVGTSIVMMSIEYDKNSALASQAILISTLFSCLTIPLLAHFI
ncbi:MAG: AEC family transporter [Eubacteriales bacterium]